MFYGFLFSDVLKKIEDQNKFEENMTPTHHMLNYRNAERKYHRLRD